MKKEDWGYYPTKNILKLKYIYIQKKRKSEAFGLDLPNLEEEQDHKMFLLRNVFIVVLIMLLWDMV